MNQRWFLLALLAVLAVSGCTATPAGALGSAPVPNAAPAPNAAPPAPDPLSSFLATMSAGVQRLSEAPRAATAPAPQVQAISGSDGLAAASPDAPPAPPWTVLGVPPNEPTILPVTAQLLRLLLRS
ncbi:MAG TPA: hypothetical protein VJB16_03410 [archaeon]|nr:hypothetical protein [archaeon]